MGRRVTGDEEQNRSLEYHFTTTRNNKSEPEIKNPHKKALGWSEQEGDDTSVETGST